VAVHRLRRRCRDVLREEIAQTVADPAEIDDELRSLFATLRGE
jgi:RNA polymerase sigma-70 factor (ECF subfamily)